MKAKAINILPADNLQKLEFTLTVDRNFRNIQKLNDLAQIITKGKELKVDIKQYMKRRSLDANAMLWAILNKMAIEMGTTKDEVYLEVLDRYGVFTHIVVKPDVVEKVKKEWKLTRELGAVEINGKKGIQLQCYFGSSSYDSKEFSVLLDGVIGEARELGIETITEAEKNSLISAWGGKQ